MNIVVLDGQMLNPGDLNWDGLLALGDRSYDIAIREGLLAKAGDIVAPFLKRPLTAIVTDTGSFRFPNTTPKTLRLPPAIWPEGILMPVLSWLESSKGCGVGLLNSTSVARSVRPLSLFT